MNRPRPAPRQEVPRRHPVRRRGVFGAVVSLLLGSVVTYLGFCFFCLALFTFITPPMTGVQVQRRVAALVSGTEYTKRHEPVPISEMSRHLPRAVVAAEDGRFYRHGGLDFEAIQEAREQARRTGRRLRGASTITQQLVKNLFMTTHRSYLRKAFEIPLTYAAEAMLSKERILELYLNVIEWGPGVYGAEAAAQYHYGISAANLTRAQSASLAACIPDPRGRTPQRMGGYSRTIQRRMRQHGW